MPQRQYLDTSDSAAIMKLIGYDSMTNKQTVIELEHHKIHEGDH